MSEENKEQVESVETEEQGQSLTAEDVQKMIQSETDKVRTEYSKKVKELEQEKKQLEQEKLSDEERKELERKEYEDKLTQKEKDLLDREVTLHAVDELKNNDLPLEFREYVKGKDVDDTSKRIKEFKKVWTNALDKAIEERFKGSGRQVQSGESEKPVDPVVDAFNQVFKKQK